MENCVFLVYSVIAQGCKQESRLRNQFGGKGMDDETAGEIIGMEQAALERWSQGDPYGFLEISAPDVIYFDAAQERRLEGLTALTSLYESIRKEIRIDRYEIIDPKVQVYGNVALLTYSYLSEGQGETQHWNCTEVYLKKPVSPWRIIHTHWSRAK
jgi:ketosteroid isomerase-like protein